MCALVHEMLHNFGCWYIFVESQMSLEQCIMQLEQQLKLPENERDIPLLMKIWQQKACFRDRREKLASLPAGQVKELLELFPLLENLVFVRMFS